MIHRVSWGSAAAMWLTFLSALFIRLQWTIFLGAGLSLLLYIWASSQNVRIHHLVRNEQGRYAERDMPDVYPDSQATIVSTGGADFFAEVPMIEEELLDKKGVQTAVVIFRVRGHESASSTGIEATRLTAVLPPMPTGFRDRHPLNIRSPAQVLGSCRFSLFSRRT